MDSSPTLDDPEELSREKPVKQLLRDAASGTSLSKFLAALVAFRSIDNSTQATQFSANRIKQFQGLHQLQSLRVAILSSFTLELIEPALRVSEFCAGRNLAFKNFAYDQWATILTLPGELDKFKPDVVFLILHLEDVVPLLAHEHLVVNEIDLDDEESKLLGLIHSCLESFRKRSSIPVILSTFIVQKRGVERYFDRRSNVSRMGRISRINDQVGKVAREVPNAFVFDYAETVSDFGRSFWFDHIAHHHTHASVSTRALKPLADEISEFLSSIFVGRRKVLALDLDNTLWHGIVGEDGPNGVDASALWPGNAYKDFQTFLKNLRATGILLVLLSKNNQADALEGFETNPKMPLSVSDFSAVKIDWNDKAANLLSVAEQLNLSPDSFVFMDDNPLEIALMQDRIPEVKTILADGTASNFTDFVLRCGGLLSSGLTEEDLGRADGYSAEKARERQKSTSQDIQSFLTSLDLSLEYRPPKDSELERITQLFTRTNQFNLTTRRYAYSDVLSFMEDPDVTLRIARLEDRFGDYGLIGVVVTRNSSDDSRREIDSFLMSCRVLGRKIEDSILTIIENDARREGVRQLIGRFIESRKNQMVSEFYLDRGFLSGDEPGKFERDLINSEPMKIPAWVTVKHDN